MSGTLTQTVASEIRAELGRQRLTGVDLARGLRKSQAYVSRRLTGAVPFDVAELERIAELLDVPVTRFLTAAPRRAA